MTHKTVELKMGYHYTGTTVTFPRSVQQIKEMLEKHGCTKTAEMKETSGQYPLVTLAFEHQGIPYMIEFPITFMVSGKQKKKTLNMNISGRIIHDRIKALLISVEIDYLSFSQAMVPYMALRSGSDMVPLESKILENLNEISTTGNFDLRLCLPGGRP